MDATWTGDLKHAVVFEGVNVNRILNKWDEIVDQGVRIFLCPNAQSKWFLRCVFIS